MIDLYQVSYYRNGLKIYKHKAELIYTDDGYKYKMENSSITNKEIANAELNGWGESKKLALLRFIMLISEYMTVAKLNKERYDFYSKCIKEAKRELENEK